jgi:Mg2+-importing ATPase
MYKNNIQDKCSKLETQQVINEFKTNSQTGLTDAEIKIRLQAFGLNKLGEKNFFWFAILFKQLINPFNVLFFIISAFSFLVHEFQNGAVILICVLINALSGFYQEYRAALNLESLKMYLAHMVTILRNGQELEIDATQIVPGDIILLVPGDILPADIRLIQTENFTLDESALTGESNPVKKDSGVIKIEQPTIFLATNIGFAGTSVLSGKSKGIVIATGKQTMMGSIYGLTIGSLQKSYLAKQLSQLSFMLFFLVFGTLALTFIINFFLKGESFPLFNFFIFSTALAITAIPEALPVVVTFALSKGVNILAQKKVIIKRLSAIEDLGRIDILCTDKTGTLTENILAVANINAQNTAEIIFNAALASETSFKNLEKLTKGFDSALWNYLKEDQKKELEYYKKVKEIPFESSRKRNTVLLKKQDSSSQILITRGMPEEVLNRSTFDAHKKQEYLSWAQQEGTLGRRVLAIAKKEIVGDISSFEEVETNFMFIGIISFSDPLKKTALEAIKKSKVLGVGIKILSGDSKEVCFTVAQQAALITSQQEILTGYAFASMDESQKKQAVDSCTVFARIDPEQKFEIIQLLQEKGYYVGYVGDGINDAPALKVANVALAVPNATDIAREAADIILIKKSLLAIINGIEEGRTIIANIFKYIKTTLSASFGNFFSLAFSTFFLHYLPMLPIQLLMVNLISDFPMIAISTDNVDSFEIKKLKKNYLKELILVALLFGSVSSIFDFIFLGLFKGYGQKTLHTGWFIFSILTELVFIFSIRTNGIFYKTKRPSFWLAFLAFFAACLSISLAYIKKFESFFQLVPLTLYQLSLLAILLIFYFTTTEIVKNYYYSEKLNV